MERSSGSEPPGDSEVESQSAVHRDPEILEGTPVFVGTRVPFQTLIDYLEEGQPLAAFLADFPTVSRDQAIAALEEEDKEAVLAHAPSSATTRRWSEANGQADGSHVFIPAEPR
jgi:uncharacterized protein (DUF433 family)